MIFAVVPSEAIECPKCKAPRFVSCRRVPTGARMPHPHRERREEHKRLSKESHGVEK